MKNINRTMLFRLVCVGIIFLCSFVFRGQQPQYAQSYMRTYQSVLNYFKGGQYVLCVYTAENLLQNPNVLSNPALYEDVVFYALVSRYRLENVHSVSEMKTYLKKYPNNTHGQELLKMLGEYHFYRLEYDTALFYYNKISSHYITESLSKNVFDAESVLYKKAYVLFQKEQYADAMVLFKTIIENKDSFYRKLSIFYYAYIHYSFGFYTSSLESFSFLEDEDFAEFLLYYKADILYKQGLYDEAISMVLRILERPNVNKEDVLYRILANAYFAINAYSEAIEYYSKLSEYKKLDRKESYNYAYANYIKQKYKDASEIFSVVINEQDSLAQNASYYLGLCYIELDEKESARDAFHKAYKLSFNNEIREDALYNYSVLTFVLPYNPFYRSVEVFNTFVEEYPTSQHIQDIQEYLVYIYATSTNYAEILDVIRSNTSNNVQFARLYQMMNYNRGIELFLNRSYAEVIPHFKEVITSSYNKQLKTRTYYWLGEAYFYLSKQDTAIIYYKKFKNNGYGFEELDIVDYNIGYAYYIQRQYKEAIEYFGQYLKYRKDTNNTMLNDAYLRIADSYYATRVFDKAQSYYTKSIELNLYDVDYAYFQKAMCLGYIKKNREKLEILDYILDRFFDSKYLVDIHFQLAETYRLLGNDLQALSYYEKVIGGTKNTQQVRQSLLEKSLIHYRQKEHDIAIQILKDVIEKTTDPSQIVEPLKNLKEIYFSIGSVNQFEKWVRSMDHITIDEKEIDSAMFIAVEKKYFEKKCDKVIENVDKYFHRFSDPIFWGEARFYRGHCLYTSKQYDEALVDFENILLQSNNPYFNSALDYAGSIYLDRKNMDSVIAKYHTLEQFTLDKELLLKSQFMQLRAYRHQNNLEKAYEYASIIKKSNTRLSKSLSLELKYLEAKYFFSTEDYEKAITHFKYISNKTDEELGSEAHYMYAYSLYKQQKYKKAEYVLARLFKRKPKYNHWIIKGYILMARLFYGQDNLVQAKLIITSLLDNYEEEDALKTEAQEFYYHLLDQENASQSVSDLDADTVTQPDNLSDNPNTN